MEETILRSERFIWDDIDNDGSLEKIIGYLQFVKLIKNGETVWESVIPGVVLSVRVADINGDGKKEIIVGSSDRRIRIYSLDGEKIKEKTFWSPGDKHAGWVWTLVVDDINNDNKLEIIAGGMAAVGGKGVAVKAFDSELNDLWSHEVKRSAFRIATYDINGDGKKEIILTTMDGFVKILDSAGKELKKTQVGAGISALDVDDIDNDQKPELLIGTVDGDFIVLSNNLKEKWKIKISSYYPAQVYNVVSRDFDGDNKKEILITGRRCVLLVDSIGKIIHKSDDNILTGDIDGDNVEEIVKFYIEEIAVIKDNKQIWKKRMPDRLEAGYIYDINNDGKKEIIVCMSDGLVNIINSSGEVLKEWNFGEQTSVIYVNDVNNDGKPEIIIGGAFGTLKIFDADGKTLHEFKLTGEIGSISVLDIDRDDKKEIVVSTKNQAGEVRIIKL